MCCVYVCRSEANIRYCTLETGPFFFFETIYVAWSFRGGLETPGILLPLHSQCVSGDLNSGTCVPETSALLTDLSPLPLDFSFSL